MSEITHMEMEKSPEFYARVARNAYLALPLFILVPIAFWWAFRLFGIPTNWVAAGIGALGWMVALVLRLPIVIPAKNLPTNRAKYLMVSVSGPLEEGIRLLALMLAGRSFPMALSLGMGWAAIEVVNTIAAVIAQAALAKRTDEKAMQATKMLEEQANGNLSSNPLWGVTERVFASGYHIGAALLIAFDPWLVIVMIPVHSLFNLAVVQSVRKSMGRLMTVLVVTGTVVFTGGILLYL